MILGPDARTHPWTWFAFGYSPPVFHCWTAKWTPLDHPAADRSSVWWSGSRSNSSAQWSPATMVDCHPTRPQLAAETTRKQLAGTCCFRSVSKCLGSLEFWKSNTICEITDLRPKLTGSGLFENRKHSVSKMLSGWSSNLKNQKQNPRFESTLLWSLVNLSVEVLSIQPFWMKTLDNKSCGWLSIIKDPAIDYPQLLRIFESKFPKTIMEKLKKSITFLPAFKPAPNYHLP